MRSQGLSALRSTWRKSLLPSDQFVNRLLLRARHGKGKALVSLEIRLLTEGFNILDLTLTQAGLAHPTCGMDEASHHLKRCRRIILSQEP